MRWQFIVLKFHWLVTCCYGYNWDGLNLPDEHVPYFFTNNPEIKAQCDDDEDCPYKVTLDLAISFQNKSVAGNFLNLL